MFGEVIERKVSIPEPKITEKRINDIKVKPRYWKKDFSKVLYQKQEFYNRNSRLLKKEKLKEAR